MRKLVVLLSGLLVLLGGYAHGQEPVEKPFILPVALQPGPSTWMLGQLYGNTTSAFNFGSQWYEAGQGLHFGLDISMPCGTPLVAVADGEVLAADALSFGSAPHNLIINHPQYGFSTLYGHLLERPSLVEGQQIKQGDFVGYSGEPDGECNARPHLHLEIRSLDYRTTFNPMDFIQANWHSLVLIGPFSTHLFQQDMDNPRRWMSLDDQPSVQFGGMILNNYQSAWPFPLAERPPVNATLARTLPPLPENITWELRQLGDGQCCARPWWHPTDANRVRVVDGLPGQRGNVFEYMVDGSVPPTIVEEAPPMLLSPDGTYQVTRVGGQVTIRRLADMQEWAVNTQGALPAVNPDNTLLLWEVWRGDYLPGAPAQTVETWVSNLDGSNARMILTQPGGWSIWLDNTRVLIVSTDPDRPDTRLTIYNTVDGTAFQLGIWDWLRNISVAPGGGRIMFYLVWQSDPNKNGVYAIDTQLGAEAKILPWFGGWQWRDADSVYYIPFDPTTQQQTLAYYHLPSGENRYLTDVAALPFSIANADWSVAPDGSKIVFVNALDRNMWVLEGK